MKLTILVPASVPSPELTTSTTPREFYEVDEFAKAVGDALRISVPVVEGTLAEAPAHGYLLAYDLPSAIDSIQAARVLALNVDRSTIMRRVEAQTLLGAIEKQRYFEWCARRADEHGGWLVAKRDAAALMSAQPLPGPYVSQHYTAISSATANSLVELLAAYLTAYARSQHEAMS